MRWSWNCLQTKFSLCTNFILQKLLTQMVNNSSLTAWGDGAHLNFINCSNLCNAHKLKKRESTESLHNRWSKSLLKRSEICSWFGMHSELNAERIFWSNIPENHCVWSAEHLTLSAGSLTSQYTLCISICIHSSTAVRFCSCNHPERDFYKSQFCRKPWMLTTCGQTIKKTIFHISSFD